MVRDGNIKGTSEMQVFGQRCSSQRSVIADISAVMG